jgi:very-short-patch-repair endonuclease
VDLFRLVDRYHHVTLGHLLASGASRSAWDRLHRAGQLVRVHPGVSRLAVIQAEPIHALHAAVLAGGPGSLVSHLSAAWLWGAEVSPDPVDLTVLDRGRGLHLDGVRVHRPRNISGLGPTRRRGLPTTDPLRTLLDVGAVAGPEVVAIVAETFLVRRYLGLVTLRRAMAAHAGPGRRSFGPLRTVLDDWQIGDVPPDSVLEVAMARLLHAHRLPSAVFHHVVVTPARSYELDFALVEQRIDVEVDGWAFHGGRAAFEADRARDAELVAIGWLVLRFTWHQVRQRPSWVAARIADAVRHRS